MSIFLLKMVQFTPNRYKKDQECYNLNLLITLNCFGNSFAPFLQLGHRPDNKQNKSFFSQKCVLALKKF